MCNEELAESCVQEFIRLEVALMRERFGSVYEKEASQSEVCGTKGGAEATRHVILRFTEYRDEIRLKIIIGDPLRQSIEHRERDNAQPAQFLIHRVPQDIPVKPDLALEHLPFGKPLQ